MTVYRVCFQFSVTEYTGLDSRQMLINSCPSGRAVKDACDLGMLECRWRFGCV